MYWLELMLFVFCVSGESSRVAAKDISISLELLSIACPQKNNTQKTEPTTTSSQHQKMHQQQQKKTLNGEGPWRDGWWWNNIEYGQTGEPKKKTSNGQDKQLHPRKMNFNQFHVQILESSFCHTVLPVRQYKKSFWNSLISFLILLLLFKSLWYFYYACILECIKKWHCKYYVSSSSSFFFPLRMVENYLSDFSKRLLSFWMKYTVLGDGWGSVVRALAMSVRVCLYGLSVINFFFVFRTSFLLLFWFQNPKKKKPLVGGLVVPNVPM